MKKITFNTFEDLDNECIKELENMNHVELVDHVTRRIIWELRGDDIKDYYQELTGYEALVLEVDHAEL